ncbi:MAG: hypothetical protein RL653_2832 [Pseudomonadota bacterium]
MATVYEVKHAGLGSTHALKVLASELSSNAEVLKRFLAEGRIQAQLKHPNVVAVTEIVTSPVAGLVMEYVEGGTLADWLSVNGRAKTKEEVLELFLPVLEAVGEAHRHGVVHRDLKPENVILGRNARGRPWPRVTDFGIARVAAEGSRLTRTGARMGTLHYMSPEQVQGAEAADARSDIFSLGAILYELVTGQRAFEGKSDLQVLKAIDEGRVRPVRELTPEVDAAVARCIERALRVAPEARFQSCAEFESSLMSRAEPPPQITSLKATPSARGGRKLAWVLTASVSLLLAGAIGWVFGQPVGSGAERPVLMVSIAGGGSVGSFKLDATEVTVAAYGACVKAGKCTEPKTGGNCNWRQGGKEQHPINCVDWMQADAYCKAQGKRLPDQAEWQFAASNGGRTQFPWGDSSPDATRAKWNSSDGTAPVGSFPAGATQSGIQDLSGNVSEWMANDYGGGKEVRGGVWDDVREEYLRASFRFRLDPSRRLDYYGFRCAQ